MRQNRLAAAAEVCYRMAMTLGRIHLLVLAAALLSGCAANNVTTSLFYMEPGDVNKLECQELMKRLGAARTRAEQANKIMGKTQVDAAGTVIGAVAYGPEYTKAHSDLRAYEAAAARKECRTEPLSGLR